MMSEIFCLKIAYSSAFFLHVRAVS